MDLSIKVLGQHPSYKLDIMIKTLVIGHSGVGKTALTKKLLFQQDLEEYVATLSFELFWNRYQLEDKIVCLQIWDTCGQENFKSIPVSFYKTSMCAFLVYSIDNKESFNTLDYWLQTIKENAREDIQIYLIGNKTDLMTKREVTYEEGDKFKIDNNLDYFIETSVNDQKSITELFEYSIRMLYEIYVNSGKEWDLNTDKKNKPKKSIILIRKKKMKMKDEDDMDSCNC